MATIENSIIEMENMRQQAMLAADIAALEALLDEELHYGHSSGGVDSRETYLAKMRSGANVYEHLELTVENVTELAHGAAMALGTMRARVRLPERTVELDSRFLTVWRHKDGRWQMVGHQTTIKPR